MDGHPYSGDPFHQANGARPTILGACPMECKFGVLVGVEDPARRLPTKVKHLGRSGRRSLALPHRSC